MSKSIKRKNRNNQTNEFAVREWILRFMKGVIIALGFILPGVSGGALAAILKLYDRMLAFLADIRSNFRENMLFFLPVGIGGLIGIGLLARPVEYLLSHYQVFVLWGFAGVIVGTIPTLMRESIKVRDRNHTDTLAFVIALLGSFAFFFFLSVSENVGHVPDNFIGFMVAGAIIALSILIPGLSTSNLLLVLGLYHPMLQHLRDFDILGAFLPMGIGGIISILIFSKIMHKLLYHFHTKAYHCILGIVISSTVLIVIPPIADYSALPNFIHFDTLWIVLLFIIGVVLGLWLSVLEEKYK